MSDNIPLPNSSLVAASDEIAGVQYQRVKVTLGADGTNDGDISATNPIPVTGTVTVSNPTAQGLTDTQLRANPVVVSVNNPTTSVNVTNFTDNGLTDAQLRATAVPVSGTVTISNPVTSVSVSNFPSTTEITNDAGNPIPVSGTVTANTGLTQPLTDTQLRATAVPVSGTVALDSASLTALENTTVTVSNPVNTVSVSNFTDNGLTDAQLRATPVPVSGTFNASVNPDDTANMVALLRALVHPIWEEAASGRLRVVLDPTGGAQTLGTVTTVSTVTTCTTVSTVTNQSQMGGIATNSTVYDTMHMAWASSVRRAVT